MQHGLMLLIISVVTIFTFILFVDPISQDPAYHQFVDQRQLFDIPNAWNVLSNLPFLLVGLAGCICIVKWNKGHLVATENHNYLVLFVGVLLTGIGSAYYHWEPTNNTLIWDRLPMAISFMALFSAIIAERIHLRIGLYLLYPLVLLGISSVFYWGWTESLGRGDLRPYAIVQFLPLILILLIIWTHPPRFTRAHDFVWVIVFYGLSKLFEFLDMVIFSLGGLISGHAIKHLLAALAAFWLLRMFLYRKPV